MSTSKLSFALSASGPDLKLVVALDQTIIYQGSPDADPQLIVHEFDDSQETDRMLSFTLTGKESFHTTLDDQGNIINDRCIMISDISMDDILLMHVFTKTAQYHHDYNGTTDSVIDEFFGVMGCNGRVEMRFTTPIYLWLLENM